MKQSVSSEIYFIVRVNMVFKNSRAFSFQMSNFT